MKRRDFFNTTGVALVKIPLVTAGHGGGDTRLQDRIFRNPDDPDPYRHGAGSPR